MKVLVCGGRDYNNKSRVWEVLDEICNPSSDFLHLQPFTIIHGGARGADSWADHWAVHNFCCVEEYKANWDRDGKAAGHIRNKKMLDEGKPDLVVAFPGGKGTAHMVKITKEAGVEVIEVDKHIS